MRQIPARRLIAFLLIVWAFAAAATPARAVVFEFEFTGVVSIVALNGGLFGPSVTPGDPFTGRFSYEVDPALNPDQDADPSMGVYDLLTFEVDQAVVPLTPVGVAVSRVEPLSTLPPAPPDPGHDRLSAIASAPGYDRDVRVFLDAPYGDAFADDSLPTSLDLSVFTEGAYVYGLKAPGIAPAPAVQDVGTLSSLEVPEPAAVWLLASALGALAIGRYRYHGDV